MAMLVSGRVYQNSERVPGIHHTRSSVPASQARPNRRREVTNTTTGTKVKELDLGEKIVELFFVSWETRTGWWQLKYFLSSPWKIGEDEPIFTKGVETTN